MLAKAGFFLSALFVVVGIGGIASPVSASASVERAMPAWLVGTWNEVPVQTGYDTDRLGFGIDGMYRHMITREVGQYGSPIPYPTLCRIFEEGRIEYLGFPTPATLDKYRRNQRALPTHSLFVRVTRVEIIPAKDNGEFCGDWLQDARERVARGESVVEWNFTAARPGVLYDPWREIEFAKMPLRRPSNSR